MQHHMQQRIQRRTLAAPLAFVCVLAAGAGCASKTDSTGPVPQLSTVVTASAPPSGAPSGAASGSPGTANPPAGGTNAPPPPPAAPQWPTPEDCVSYNPNALTVNYEAGKYAVLEGSRVVVRVNGGPGQTIGDKILALAQRYRRHCFIGRGNTREDSNAYIFDYWRDSSGMTPPIADQEDDCSGYDRNNLDVNDMGSGHGWRVKDHDHVLHVFNNESDARNGKLVLSRYQRICFIGDNDDDNAEVVSYSL